LSPLVVTQPVASTRQSAASGQQNRLALPLVTMLTGLALLVHGYHPYAEDGGLYVAGIKRLLDPTLYPQVTGFVLGHLRFSLFAPAIAMMVRASHLELPTILLLLHLASIWISLFAVWLLAARCYESQAARTGAVALVATWLTLPVAGTSQILMDPYLTARSISLPCALMALVGVLDMAQRTSRQEKLRGVALCLLSLLLAAVMHPLMAAYALANVLLLGCMHIGNRAIKVWGTAALCSFAVVTAAATQAMAQPESAAYIRVAMTRYYWFLSQWHWYELLGLVAPLAILSLVAFGRRPKTGKTGENDAFAATRRSLASMAVAVGTTAIVIALAFARERAATHLVARLQPLRSFQIIYVLMTLMIGATLGERLLRGRAWRWIATFGLLGGVMFFAQRSTYPHSPHLELPAHSSTNRWEQAFVWISRNTPKNALFAMDANYISKPGEDAQSFRAIAERSALPDYSKDGGEASITPSLTEQWAIGQRAQTALSAKTDTERLTALQPLGVNWILLQRSAATTFTCPYANDTVKVCQLP